MTKQKILLLIPLLLIAASIMYCWYTFVAGNLLPVWQHYLAWFALVPLAYFFFKDGQFTKALLATGIYLILATANVLALRPVIVSTGFRIGALSTAGFNSYALLLLVVYGVLNTDNLINTYLEYKEAKGKS